MTPTAGEALWYFAYGANMSPEVLTRRGITPLSSEAARLDDYRLRFSHAGLFILEPAFANIEEEPGACVHGVLHLVARRAMQRLNQLEGAEYGLVEVIVVGRQAGAVTARAYLDRNLVRGRRPSKRYLDACCAGAKAFDLPDEYLCSLKEQPSLHVPLLSPLTTRLVGTAERARLGGLRPERVRMALRRRIRSQSASLESSHGSIAANEPGGDSRLERWKRGRTGFWLPAESVQVTTEEGPAGFYERLRAMLRSAHKRIVIASLYFGTGAREQELLDDIAHALRANCDLQLQIVLDHSRALRETSNGDSTTMLADLIRTFPGRVQLFLHRMPQLEGPRGWLPSPLNECIAVCHFKALVVDDTAIVTGANLSDEYFHCRQARYWEIRDRPFADLSCAVVQATARASWRVSWNAPTAGFEPPIESPRLLPRVIDKIVSAATSSSQPGDTFLCFVFQHPSLGLQQEARLLEEIFASRDGELVITTPYPNMPASYVEALQSRVHASTGKTLIICPSENSHSFTTGRGLKGLVPSVYLHRERQLHRALAANAQAGDLEFRRYDRPGWVFHSKGLWLTTTRECATVIGSSSFGERSVSRDFDMSALVVTSNPRLRESLNREVATMLHYAPRVLSPAAPSSMLGPLLTPLVKSYL